MSLPTPQRVREKFEVLSPNFNLCGDGYRSFQDISCRDQSSKPIESLIFGMPGENTYKLNRDLFCKRNTIQQLCPSCAAMALMALQVNGPKGGKGHRTGIRGGGPLTSIVLGRSIPETIWLNTIPEDAFYLGLDDDRKDRCQDIFPWMGPLRTSEGGSEGLTTGITDVSQLQMFWPMPRRILLDTDTTREGTCDICGEETSMAFTSMKTKPYGVSYDGSWRHVLTPYEKNSKGDVLPVHLQPGGITYQHWVGLVQNDRDAGREVARVVQRFRNIQASLSDLLPDTLQMWAFGYDFKDVNARCWYDSYMPLVQVPETIKEDYEIYTSQIVRAAQYVNDMVHGCVKDALYKSEIDGAPLVKNPKNLTIVKTRFWDETESLFYKTLNDLRHALDLGESVEQVKSGWAIEARKIGLNLFDFYAQTQYLDEYRPKAIVAARKRLFMTISPGAPRMRTILSLPKET